MPFVPDAVVEFPIGTLKGFIGFVRVLEDKWLWKSIFQLCNESWKQLRSLIPTDWLTRWKRVVLTDNFDGSYHKEFIWLYQSFNFWLEWVGKGIESTGYYQVDKKDKLMIQTIIEAAAVVSRIQEASKWELTYQHTAGIANTDIENAPISSSDCTDNHTPDCYLSSWAFQDKRWQVWWLKTRITWHYVLSFPRSWQKWQAMEGDQ